MVYAMSDIHGCYNEYLEALRRINFREEDTLYVLGDCVDRGYASMKLLLDMMGHSNIIPIIGNHDMEALFILNKLCHEITEETIEQVLDVDFMASVNDWLSDGGEQTLKEFQRLSLEERQAVLEYLGEFSLYEEVEAGGNVYLMVHGGLEPFAPEKPMEDYDILELLLSRPDYDRMYFEDKYTITGHTPTINQEGNNGVVIRKNNHIAIDCGCVFGYNLAALCLDTGEEFYIPFQR